MPLVVPTVCRFAVNQELEGRAVVNVLDLHIDTTGSTMSREEACSEAAGNIINSWTSRVMPGTVDDLKFQSVSWVDLNSATGSTGSRTSTSTTTLPVDGSSTDAPLPSNTAMLVTKQTTSGRGKRNGRMFIAGQLEGQTETSNGSMLLPAFVSSRNAAMASLLTDLEKEDTIGTAYEGWLVVVHVTARDSAGNPTEGEHSKVTALTVDPLLATQRRRMRG